MSGLVVPILRCGSPRPCEFLVIQRTFERIGQDSIGVVDDLHDLVRIRAAPVPVWVVKEGHGPVCSSNHFFGCVLGDFKIFVVSAHSLHGLMGKAFTLTVDSQQSFDR